MSKSKPSTNKPTFPQNKPSMNKDKPSGKNRSNNTKSGK